MYGWVTATTSTWYLVLKYSDLTPGPWKARMRHPGATLGMAPWGWMSVSVLRYFGTRYSELQYSWTHHASDNQFPSRRQKLLGSGISRFSSAGVVIQVLRAMR